MTGLVTALLLFVVLHSVPAIPPLRGRIIAAIGRRAYFIAYSALSTAAIVWLFYEALNTDYIELWEPAPWQAWMTFVLAPAGLFLVIAGLISPNPLSVTIREDKGQAGAVVRITRHPVLWGFLLWSSGHLVPNGDLRSLILFGGFALFSAGGMAMQERRSRRKLGQGWERIAAGTSILPFGGTGAEGGRRWDLSMTIALVATVLLVSWLLAGGHQWLVGVDPLLAAAPV